MNEYTIRKRRKNTAQIPTTNKFWAQVGGASSTNSESKFQTPDHQQESLVDLTDDNSPHVAASPAVVEKTVIKGNILTKGSPSPQKQQQENQGAMAAQASQKNDSTKNPSEDFTKDEPMDTANQASVQPSKVVQDKPKSDPNTPLMYLVGKPSRSAPVNKPKPKEVNNSKQKMTKKQNKMFSVYTPAQLAQIEQQKLENKQLWQNRFVRTYPSGIPRSMLAQQEELARQQQLQHLFELQQQQMLQQHVAPQLNMPNPFPQQPMPGPNWGQPQPTLVQDQLYQMPYNEAMAGFNPTPQTYVPPVPPVDQAPQHPSFEMQANTSSDTKSESHERSVSPDFQTGQQRLSAFKRLGPLTQPTKPKLTINLLFNKEESVREVVDRTDEKPEVEPYQPVHLRPNITTSTDETVMKFLINWPWKKTVSLRRTATVKSSKSAMLLEREQMEESYDSDNVYIQISVRGYPPTWKKEDVLDALLEQINLIPCFIDFRPKECKFFVIRSRAALLNIHKLGFVILKEGAVMQLSISVTTVTLNQIDFIPRLILRKRLAMVYNGEDTLNLKSFTTGEDISHFIYFPLNCQTNQSELLQMQSVVAWEHLTSLDLSHNRMTSIERFHLQTSTPKLRHLDLSHNKLDKITLLLRTRTLPLRSIKLEGNPLCHDYIDPSYYVKVVRTLYPGIKEIDGVEIHLKGDLPKFHKHYCPHGAEHIADKFLDVFFPLLDSAPEDRLLIEDLYDENALITITYEHKYLMRQFRAKPVMSRYREDLDKEIIEGAVAMTKTISKWPPLKHDPFTFTVDVIYHSDTSTIIKVDGILKTTSETLAEDEHVISFTRTVVLRTRDGVEYKIRNEILYWYIPTVECADTAFQITKVRSTRLSLDLESTPDDDLKEKLTGILMTITELDKKASERCLEKKDWNLRSALDYFIQLLKLDDLQSLTMDTKVKS